MIGEILNLMADSFFIVFYISLIVLTVMISVRVRLRVSGVILFKMIV